MRKFLNTILRHIIVASNLFPFSSDIFLFTCSFAIPFFRQFLCPNFGVILTALIFTLFLCVYVKSV